ncbi:MAG: type II secretion system minor pseudopilin GspK [Lautropia sp.]|nr:type II secretion system minor pseudopilin GspK [Lautropia sp.]
MASSSRHFLQAQQGAAIVTALLVVALVTVIVSSLFYRESVAVRSIENRATLSQTRWIERAVIDWAKVILRNSPRDVDSALSIWATPVVETQLDETVTGGAKIGDAERQVFLAGRIHDAQSRFNVNALLRESFDPSNPGGQGGQGGQSGQGGGGQPDGKAEGGPPDTGASSQGAGQRRDPTLSAEHVEAMKRLMGLLSLPESLVDQILLRLRRVAAQNAGRGGNTWVMPLVRLDDLRDLPGFSDEVMEKLEPHLTVLPADARTVNVNSASVEVLSAVAPTWSQPAIRSFVANRDRLPAPTLDASQLSLGGNTTLPATLVDVKSAYFLADGIIRYDRVESHTETLLNRAPTGQVKVIWQHRN